VPASKVYPKILETIAAENHEQAILFITYAWKAEKQHRKLILKIKKASKRFFWIVGGPYRRRADSVLRMPGVRFNANRAPCQQLSDLRSFRIRICRGAGLPWQMNG
jgi:hypothetical protein